MSAGTAERRLVSVLFADLVGFTAFSEGRDAERVRETLSRYFDQARAVVERHGGVVEKFIGDAVMAVWGTPVAREDDAERAVRAALDLLPAVRAVDPSLQARAGVLSGEAAVSVGVAGEGMVAGDLVNTAARLQSMAEPGTVLVGESTMLAAGSAVAFEPAGEHELKGKSSPVPAWRAVRLVGTTGGRTRSAVPEPPFVGRELELEVLKESVHAAGRDRRPRLVAVVGPAGIGKSRLARELEKYLDGMVEQVSWLRGRSPSYGEGIAFWALGEMVRRRAGLAETDDEATTRARILEVAAAYVDDEGDRAWVESSLLTLLGVEPPPAGGSEALFGAWRTFLEAMAARSTMVLVFEDLQWADSGLLDFIDHLLDWSKSSPLVVLALTRPELLERRPEFGRGNWHFQSVPLSPLADSVMDELLAGLVPDLPESARQAIVARADGIPLYAVETIRMLVADGRLEPAEDGRLRSARELGELTVPDSLRALVAARLDALEATDKALLQRASVLGLAFTLDALQAVSDLAEGEVAARLRALVRRDVLAVQADPRSPERGQYAFVQSVIREVAYGMLGRRERRRLHLAAARHWEALADEELAGAVATHYLAAHEASDRGPEADAVAAQARVALRAAAGRATDLGAHGQALSHLERAIAVTSGPGDRADLMSRAAGAAAALGRYDQAVEFARSAVETHRRVGDAVAAARAAAGLATVLIDAHRITEAGEVIEAELDRVPAEAPDVRAELLSRLSRVRMRMDRRPDSLAAADEALAIAERLNLTVVVADALVNKGAALADSGRRREALAVLRAGAELATAEGQMGLHIRALTNIAATLSDDDPVAADSTVRQALELERRLGYQSNWLLGMHASFAFWLGENWDEALRTLDDAVAQLATPGQRVEVGAPAVMIRFFRGEAGQEDVERIRRDAAETDDPRILEGWAAGVAADQALTSGDLAAAYDGYLRVHDVSELNQVALEHALRAAFWMRDVERAEAVMPRLERSAFTGRITEALRKHAAAGIAALKGDRRAGLAGLLESLAELRSTGMHFGASLIALDALHLLPDEPSVVAAAKEAREIFERVGARPMLQRLDRLLAQAPASTEPAGRGERGSPAQSDTSAVTSSSRSDGPMPPPAGASG